MKTAFDKEMQAAAQAVVERHRINFYKAEALRKKPPDYLTAWLVMFPDNDVSDFINSRKTWERLFDEFNQQEEIRRTPCPDGEVESFMLPEMAVFRDELIDQWEKFIFFSDKHHKYDYILTFSNGGEYEAQEITQGSEFWAASEIISMRTRVKEAEAMENETLLEFVINEYNDHIDNYLVSNYERYIDVIRD